MKESYKCLKCAKVPKVVALPGKDRFSWFLAKAGQVAPIIKV
jgi:hypothetical protein